MTLADLESEIVRQTRRRQMYSGLAVLKVAAVLIAGFDLSNSMNSGSFWNGLGQFFDYPAGLLSEAWETGLIGMLELVITGCCGNVYGLRHTRFKLREVQWSVI